jgi:hypothetical protein
VEEDARKRITNAVDVVEIWAQELASKQKGGIEIQREVDIVSTSMCLVEESHSPIRTGCIPTANIDGCVWGQGI